MKSHLLRDRNVSLLPSLEGFGLPLVGRPCQCGWDQVLENDPNKCLLVSVFIIIGDFADQSDEAVCKREREGWVSYAVEKVKIINNTSIEIY